MAGKGRGSEDLHRRHNHWSHKDLRTNAPSEADKEATDRWADLEGYAIQTVLRNAISNKDAAMILTMLGLI